MSDQELGKLIELETEQAEITRHHDIVGSPTRLNRAKSVVYSVRLSADDVARLEKAAERLGVPAAAMARGFVLEGIRSVEGTESVPSIVERVTADMEKLRAIVSR